MEVREVLRYLPVATMFDIFTLTFFFGYATENGTFSVLVSRIIFRFRRQVWLIMPALYVLSFLSASVGPGIMAAAFMAPVAFNLAQRIKTSPLLAYGAVALGCVSGSNFIHSSGGAAVYRMIQSGSLGQFCSQVSAKGFLTTGAVATAAFIILYITCRGWDAQLLGEYIPAALSSVQKKTVIVMGVTLLFSFLPHFSHCFFPELWLSRNADRFDTCILMMIGCCAASALRLSNDKKVLHDYVPWNLIAMIGSMGMLLGVGESLGMVDSISQMVSRSVPIFLVAPLLALIAGLMSVFTSAIGVVIPTLFALVPDLSAVYGLSPIELYTAIFSAATITGVSPLSTTGGMTLSGCSCETDRERLFYQSLFLPFTLLVIIIAVSFWL